MTQGFVLDLMKEALLICFKLAGPLLAVSMIVGLVVAVFQAATQINEQTLTFVPKVVVLSIALLGLGSWMITLMTEFMRKIFELMATL